MVKTEAKKQNKEKTSFCCIIIINIIFLFKPLDVYSKLSYFCKIHFQSGNKSEIANHSLIHLCSKSTLCDGPKGGAGLPPRWVRKSAGWLFIFLVFWFSRQTDSLFTASPEPEGRFGYPASAAYSRNFFLFHICLFVCFFYVQLFTRFSLHYYPPQKKIAPEQIENVFFLERFQPGLSAEIKVLCSRLKNVRRNTFFTPVRRVSSCVYSCIHTKTHTHPYIHFNISSPIGAIKRRRCTGGGATQRNKKGLSFALCGHQHHHNYTTILFYGSKVQLIRLFLISI